MNNFKPRKVKAKISRTVTEIAIVYLDRDGCVEEYEECCEEIDSEVDNIHSIISVITSHE